MPVPPDEQAFLQLLRAGDQQAARKVFHAYVNRLLYLARERLSQQMARRIDPEDIVQSVFRTFFHRVQAGQFSSPEQVKPDTPRSLAAVCRAAMALKDICHSGRPIAEIRCETSS